MAAITSLPSSLFFYPTTFKPIPPPPPSSSSFNPFLFSSSSSSFPSLRLKRIPNRTQMAIKAVAEEEEQTLASPVEETLAPDQTVSVPVSPSDSLTMFFKAEGSMNESSISKVSKSLEEIEGISDLKVQIAEGIASVELTKQTTVQATGVASNLVEVIQGSGFKLQTLNLSFEDEEDAMS